MEAGNRTPAIEPIIRRHMPELDTIRGIAILSVFAFHGFEDLVWPPFTRPLWQHLPLAVAYQGWAGVNLFFVLSGFLITGILLETRERADYYSRFYRHRALRILPAFYAMLLILFLLRWFGILVRSDLGEFLALSLIYLSNVTPLFGVSVGYWTFWSLAVEEHFYLVWPALVRKVSRRALTITAIAVCLIEPALRFYALHSGTELRWAGPQRLGSFRYTWLSADPLAVGALLAIFARSDWGNRRSLLTVIVFTSGATAAGMLLSRYLSSVAGVWLRATLVNYGALAILASALWLGSGPYRRWVDIRVLSFYGYISYGLYLIHDIINELYSAAGRSFAPALYVGNDLSRGCVRFCICLSIGTAIAYLSRNTFEQYFLRLKDRPSKSKAAARSPTAA